MRHLILIAISVALLLGVGCAPLGISTAPNPAKTPAWTALDGDTDRYETAAKNRARLVLYRFKKGAYAWRFAHNRDPHTIEAWAAAEPGAAFIVNGIYFDETYAPTGLLVTGGKNVAGRKYDDNLVGLIALAPETKIIDTSKEPYDVKRLSEGGQSFPLIIKDGAPVATFKDARPSRRSFIGNDRDGNMYLGAVSEDTITFADLAAALESTGVKWNNVLNLDGGTSTGYVARFGQFTETAQSIVQVPNVIVVERK